MLHPKYYRRDGDRLTDQTREIVNVWLGEMDRLVASKGDTGMNFDEMFSWFTRTEFDCRCGCGYNVVKPQFLLKLDLARTFAGIPFVLNSGCRCPDHNKAVKSTSENHIIGVAADIRCNTSSNRHKVLSGLFAVGFQRIGVYRTYIHVDDNPDAPQGVFWL